jgi:predicted ester cyclase
MSRPENIAVVEALIAALNANDLQSAYRHYLPEARHLGQPRPVEGVGEMRKVDAEFFAAFPDHHRELRQLVVDGDTIAALLDITGTNTRPRAGAAPTGRAVRFTVCNIIELQAGRVRSMRQIYDSAELSRQLAAGETHAAPHGAGGLPLTRAELRRPRSSGPAPG